MRTSTCRSCGAEIIWAEMPSGKKCPMDAEDSPAGEWALDEDGGTVYATRLNRAVGSSEPGYTSHFATCPDRDEHRRRA